MQPCIQGGRPKQQQQHDVSKLGPTAAPAAFPNTTACQPAQYPLCKLHPGCSPRRCRGGRTQHQVQAILSARRDQPARAAQFAPGGAVDVEAGSAQHGATGRQAHLGGVDGGRVVVQNATLWTLCRAGSPTHPPAPTHLGEPGHAGWRHIPRSPAAGLHARLEGGLVWRGAHRVAPLLQRLTD